MPTPVPRRQALLRDDSGVIAVVTAIVVAAVLVPVAALGLTSYVRVSVREEMQRAAESGALAGAASLGLLDTGSLLGGGIVDDALAIPDTFTALGPTGRACRAAATAHGRPLTDPARDPADRSPTSAAFASAPACDARYTQDPAFGDCVDDVFLRVRAVTDVVDQRLVEVTGLLGSLTSALLPSVTTSRDIAASVQRLVPAVTHNGVRVELAYTVQGPLDGVFAPGPVATATTAAAARRLFKPVLPDLTQLDALPVGQPLDQVLELTDLLDGPMATTERIAVAQLQAVVLALRVVLDETDQASLEVALGDALEKTLSVVEELLLEVLGPVDLLTAGLVSALLEPLRRDVVVPATADLGLCLGAVDEVLADLAYAVTINTDPDDQDLVPCLVDHVLGLDLTSVSPVQTCVNRVFRAQLAPV